MFNEYAATLRQGVQFLQQLPPALYSAQPSFCDSPIGKHVRHIVDHFEALRCAVNTHHVDYENRQRGAAIEHCQRTALLTLSELHDWVLHLSNSALENHIQVRADVGIDAPHYAQVASTLGRELMFCASHAIHHYALMKIIAEAFGMTSDAQFGLAPSTAHQQKTA